MYTIKVKFYDAHRLYEAHSKIKSLDFVIGELFDYVEDAHEAAVVYVNKYFAKLNQPIEFLTKVAAIPRNRAQWDKVPLGYYCTEQPTEWTLDVWHKRIERGFFGVWSASKIERIFSLRILQVYSEETATCIDSPATQWHYTPEVVQDYKATRGGSVWDLSKLSNEVDDIQKSSLDEQ